MVYHRATPVGQAAHGPHSGNIGRKPGEQGLPSGAEQAGSLARGLLQRCLFARDTGYPRVRRDNPFERSRRDPTAIRAHREPIARRPDREIVAQEPAERACHIETVACGYLGSGHGDRNVISAKMLHPMNIAMLPEPFPYLVVAITGRALAASAGRGNLPVVVLDCFADRDTFAASRACRAVAAPKSIRLDRRALLAAARELAPPEGCAGLVYGSGFEGRPELVSRLSVGRRLFGNSPAVIESGERSVPVLPPPAPIGDAIP